MTAAPSPAGQRDHGSRSALAPEDIEHPSIRMALISLAGCRSHAREILADTGLTLRETGDALLELQAGCLVYARSRTASIKPRRALRRALRQPTSLVGLQRR